MRIQDIARFGRMLARFEAPRVRLRLWKDLRGSYDPAKRLIRWSPVSGLSTLLHEIGHHQLGHKVWCREWQAIFKMEVAAWMQAERIAERWGLTLDYLQAEQYLASYLATIPWQQLGLWNNVVKWRNR